VGDREKRLFFCRDRAFGNQPSVHVARSGSGEALPKPTRRREDARGARRGSSKRRVWIGDARVPSRRERGMDIQEKHAHRVDAQAL